MFNKAAQWWSSALNGVICHRIPRKIKRSVTIERCYSSVYGVHHAFLTFNTTKRKEMTKIVNDNGKTVAML